MVRYKQRVKLPQILDPSNAALRLVSCFRRSQWTLGGPRAGDGWFSVSHFLLVVDDR